MFLRTKWLDWLGIYTGQPGIYSVSHECGGKTQDFLSYNLI